MNYAAKISATGLYYQEKVRAFSADSVFTTTLGLARSVLAMGLLLTLLSNPVENLLYTDAHNEIINPLLTQSSKYNFFMLFGIHGVVYAKALGIVILLVVVSGYFIRISALLHWWVSWSFFFFSSAIDGGDQLGANLALLLLPICLLDNRTNHWHRKIASLSDGRSTGEANHYVNLTCLLFYLLIRLQLAAVYFHAFVGKFKVEEWANGTAVYYWLNNPLFGMPSYLHPLLDPVLHSKSGVVLITYGVILFEIMLFLCITMSKERRRKFFLPAVIFHLSIILVHGIFSFFFYHGGRVSSVSTGHEKGFSREGCLSSYLGIDG